MLHAWLSLAASTLKINLPPGTTTIAINIGSNLNPIPADAANESTIVIAFEPIVHARIKPHPRLLVVPAAVDAEAGLATMKTFGVDGVAASLSAPSQLFKDRLGQKEVAYRWPSRQMT